MNDIEIVSMGKSFKLSKIEGSLDDGEMPPLEGADEDASRMEEVNEMFKNFDLKKSSG